MTITLDQIVEEVAELPEDVSAELVERILIRRHGGIDSSIEKSWETEISRRISEIKEGRINGIPLEETFAHAGKLLAR